MTSFSPDYSMYTTTVAPLVNNFYSEFSYLFPCNKNTELEIISFFALVRAADFFAEAY